MHHEKRPKKDICILFTDDDIAEVFHELLSSMGTEVTLIDQVDSIPEGSSLITEPSYVPLLPSSIHEKCLVVGNRGALEGLPTLCLSRPLTEEKVESALREFLSR